MEDMAAEVEAMRRSEEDITAAASTEADAVAGAATAGEATAGAATAVTAGTGGACTDIPSMVGPMRTATTIPTATIIRMAPIPMEMTNRDQQPDRNSSFGTIAMLPRATTPM
jgi:hypothetical protein